MYTEYSYAEYGIVLPAAVSDTVEPVVRAVHDEVLGAVVVPVHHVRAVRVQQRLDMVQHGERVSMVTCRVHRIVRAHDNVVSDGVFECLFHPLLLGGVLRVGGVVRPTVHASVSGGIHQNHIDTNSMVV